MTNRIIVMCGLPGSGKSTYLSKIRHQAQTVVICPDDYREALTGRKFFAPAEEAVWSAVKVTVRVLAKNGYNVYIDATNTSVGQRAQWIKIAQELYVLAKCIVFKTSIEECKERNSKREFPVPDDIIDRMYAKFETPSTEEGFFCIEHH